MAIKLKATERKIVEEGAYLAKLVSVEEATGKYGDYLKFKFTIIEEGDYENTNITGLVNKSLQVGNKLFKWLTALNGQVINPGDDIVVDEMIGKKCKLIVSNKTDDDGTVTYKIESIMAVKKKPAPQPVEEEEAPAPKKKLAAAEEEEEERAPKKKALAAEEEEEPAPKKKKPAEFEDDEF